MNPKQYNQEVAAGLMVDQEQTDTACYLCGTKFKPSKDARAECQLRSAKSNLEKHSLTKGDAKHKALADKLREEDPNIDYW